MEESREMWKIVEVLRVEEEASCEMEQRTGVKGRRKEVSGDK